MIADRYRVFGVWVLADLLSHAQDNETQIDGEWVPYRPIRGPFIGRLRAAFWVLLGRADAVVWPKDQ